MTCSLVCRTWLQEARPILFHMVALIFHDRPSFNDNSPTPRIRTFSLFLDFLHRSPALCACIQDLRLCRCSEGDMAQEGTTTPCATLVDILSRLPNLYSFHICMWPDEPIDPSPLSSIITRAREVSRSHPLRLQNITVRSGIDIPAILALLSAMTFSPSAACLQSLVVDISSSEDAVAVQELLNDVPSLSDLELRLRGPMKGANAQSRSHFTHSFITLH